MSFDLVIGGGVVIDGSGGPSQRVDVGIRSGRIEAIGDLRAVEGARRLDATGRVVAPGFVDIHSHSDFTLLVDPSADSAIAQGVTTEIVGNCGHGCAPIAAGDDPRFTSNIYGWGHGVRALDWTTVDGYLDAHEAARPALNVATLVPLGNLRLLAVDDVEREALADELARMLTLLEAALDEGAIGLSTGLEYPAERAAGRTELDALARVVAARDRLCAMHTRDRGLGVVGGTAEAIAIARAAGVRLQVSHILARRGSGGAAANEQIAALLEDAAANLPVGWDVHTRLFGITNLSTAIAPSILRAPPAHHAWALREFLDPIRVRPEHDTVIASFGRAGWDRTYILDAGAGWSSLEGIAVAAIADVVGLEPAEVLVAILRDAAESGDVHRPLAFATTYDESDIATAVQTSRCMVGSDGTTMSLDSPLRARGLPGAFTWAAWFLRRVIHDWRAVPLEEAIRRITALPADQAGLGDRGRVAVGARADLAIFDPETIREPTNPVRPTSLATGVDHVLVNGVLTWSGGRLTGDRAGEVIRA